MNPQSLSNILALCLIVGLICLAGVILSIIWVPAYERRTKSIADGAGMIRQLCGVVYMASQQLETFNLRGESIVSKATELNQAISDLSVAANNVAGVVASALAGGTASTANMTPDDVVSNAITSITGIRDQLAALLPTTPTPAPTSTVPNA